jgi:hypothetical protein
MHVNGAPTEGIIDRAARIITEYFPPPFHITFQHINRGPPKTFISVHSPVHSSVHNPTSICIQCDIFDSDLSTLHISALMRCGDPSEQEGKYIGSRILRQIIEFSKACGFSQITLEDQSIIEYDTTDGPIYKKYFISLQELLRLKTGQSWYEGFGFTNEKIIQYKSKILKHIHKSIGDVNPELLPKLQKDVPDITGITGSTTVSETVTRLYEYLQVLCPERICNPKSKLNTVSNIYGIIGVMNDTMLTEIGAAYKDFEELSLSLLQKGSSRTRRKRARKAKRRRTRRM